MKYILVILLSLGFSITGFSKAVSTPNLNGLPQKHDTNAGNEIHEKGMVDCGNCPAKKTSALYANSNGNGGPIEAPIVPSTGGKGSTNAQ